MAFSHAEVARHIARSLRQRNCWLAPDVRADLEAAGLPFTPTGDVVVVAADAIAADGVVFAAAPVHAPPSDASIVAWLSASEGIGAPPRPSDAALGRAWKIFTGLGVLEVQNGRLVIVEVAPGVSARDMQSQTDLRLWVSPTLSAMARP